MEELYLELSFFKGYKISNLGNLRNKRNKLIAGSIDSDGYRRFSLYVNGKMKYVPCHRLVAIQFIANYDNKPQVNHKDGNKLNNSISNLEWVTSKENVLHSYKTGLKKPSKANLGNFGINSTRHKDCIQISKDGFIIEQYDSIMDAKRKTGISNVSISRVISGKLKQAGGYLWQ